MQENFSIFYDWQNLKINYEVIEEGLATLGKHFGYSAELVSFLAATLVKDEDKRVSVNQMAEVFYTGVGGIDLRSKPRFESINSGRLGTTFRDTTKTTMYTKGSGMPAIDEEQ